MVSPGYLRSDNGPEFIAKAIQDWTKEQRIGSIYITPGSPWEQAHVESFHDKLRDECLNRELFGSLAEARLILEQWRVEYNQATPAQLPGLSDAKGVCGAPQSKVGSCFQGFE